MALRDHLGLRKKLKARDWGTIHSYASQHGYKKAEYSVCLGNRLIPSSKVWKEIRRNGFHKKAPGQYLVPK